MKSNIDRLGLTCIAILIVVLCVALFGCSTISPALPAAHSIAYGTDGLQDAGVKGVVVDVKTGEKFLLISEKDREAFNVEVAKYGKMFVPPVTKDEGLIPYHGQWAARNDIMADFTVMNAFQKRDQP